VYDENGKQLLNVFNIDNAMRCLAYHPEGRYMALGDQKEVKIVDTNIP